LGEIAPASHSTPAWQLALRAADLIGLK